MSGMKRRKSSRKTKGKGSEPWVRAKAEMIELDGRRSTQISGISIALFEAEALAGLWAQLGKQFSQKRTRSTSTQRFKLNQRKASLDSFS